MEKAKKAEHEPLTEHQLFLRIRLSARYHQQRQKVLLRRSRLINLGNIILSLGVVASLLDQFAAPYDLAFPAFIAILSAADTVFGFTASAFQHETLYRRFMAIEAEFIGSKDPDLQKIHAAVVLVEADEPPVNQNAVDLCDNEIRIAAGHKEIHQVGLLGEILAHI